MKPTAEKVYVWNITRIISEEFCVEATSKEEAAKKLLESSSGPHTVTVLKEIVKKINP